MANRLGIAPEARIDVTYFEETRHVADGATYSLRFPVYDVVETYQPLPADVLFSPRMAPPVFDRGLLEAIPEETILALADPGDSDGDGISGRPNRVYNFRTQQTELGRFGLKANNPDLLQQVAGAYQQDMGITNPYFPEDSTVGQPQMDDHRDDPEIGQETLDINTFYVQTLAVPARRNIDDPQALRGEALFAAAQCSGCHIPTLQTGPHEIAALANQTIHPYTDLLLHDMGEELADDRPDFEADGREWRTPPLWGIALTATVSGIPAYLHDGRARTLMEAIMFHGGEAETAREFVRQDVFDGTHQVLGARIDELDSTRILGCLDVVDAAPDAAGMDMSPVRATRWIDDRPHGADPQLIGPVISELAAHHGRGRVDVLNQSRKRDVLVQLDVAVPTPQLREV